MIYLDNSATSYFKPPEMIEAVSRYLLSPGNPGRGINRATLSAASYVFDTRIKISEFFNFSDFTKVVFTSGITESLNVIINALIKQEDHVITTYLEHNSVLRPLYKKKCELKFTDGTIESIKKEIKKNTRAVVVNHVSNVTGEIQDITNIAKWCKENKILCIVDTAQSAGVLKIDVKASPVDIICFTGHKGLLGMQGIGGILVNTDEYIEPLKYGGTGVHSFDKKQPDDYPTHLEAGTLNVPGIISLNHSIEYINKFGIEKIYEHETMLRKIAVDYLESRKDIEIYENKNKNCVGVVSFNVKNLDSAIVGDKLSNEYDIAVRTGAHCAPLVMEHYGQNSTVRISFGLNNTKEDVDKFICAMENIK